MFGALGDVAARRCGATPGSRKLPPLQASHVPKTKRVLDMLAHVTFSPLHTGARPEALRSRVTTPRRGGEQHTRTTAATSKAQTRTTAATSKEHSDAGADPAKVSASALALFARSRSRTRSDDLWVMSHCQGPCSTWCSFQNSSLRPCRAASTLRFLPELPTLWPEIGPRWRTNMEMLEEGFTRVHLDW